MEEHEATDPLNVGLFGPAAVVTKPHGVPNAVEEARGSSGSRQSPQRSLRHETAAGRGVDDANSVRCGGRHGARSIGAARAVPQARSLLVARDRLDLEQPRFRQTSISSTFGARSMMNSNRGATSLPMSF